MSVAAADAGRLSGVSQRYNRAGDEGAGPARRLGRVEAPEADPFDGGAVAAVVRHLGHHRDPLTGGHDAVVGEDVEPQAVGQHHRAFVLGLLPREPEVDLEGRVVGQAERVEVVPEGADRPEPRQQGHPLGLGRAPLVDLEGGGGVAGQPGQRLDEGGRRLGAGVAGEARDGGVDPVEERALLPPRVAGDDGGVEPVADRRRPRQADQRRHALALVHAAGVAPDLGVGAAQQRVEPAEVDGGPARRRGAAAEARGRPAGPAAGAPEPAGEAEGGEPVAEVELLRLPRPQPVCEMLREPGRIGGGRVGLSRDDRRGLVVLAPALAVGAHRDDDVGPDGADEADEVAEDDLPPPRLERLLAAERIAEVDGAGEELLGPVEAVRGLQLLAPQHRQGVEELGADLVLAAVAAGGADQGGAHPLAVAQQRQQAVDLVVGVSHRRHERAGVVELPQHEPELGPAVGGLRRLGPRGRPRQGEENKQGTDCRQSACLRHDPPSIPAAKADAPPRPDVLPRRPPTPFLAHAR